MEENLPIQPPVSFPIYKTFTMIEYSKHNHQTWYTPRQKKKRQLISDHIKGPLVAAFGSPLMKALDSSVETLGL